MRDRSETNERENRLGLSALLLLMLVTAAAQQGVFYEVMGQALVMGAVCLLGLAVLYPVVSVPLALFRHLAQRQAPQEPVLCEVPAPLFEELDVPETVAPPPVRRLSPLNYAATAGMMTRQAAWNDNRLFASSDASLSSHA